MLESDSWLKCVNVAIGKGVLFFYNNSQALGIMVEYPDYHWKPWNFDRSPARWWQYLGEAFNKSNDPLVETAARCLIEDIGKAYGVTNLSSIEEWERVSLDKVDSYRLAYLSSSLKNIIMRLYHSNEYQAHCTDSSLGELKDAKGKFIPVLQKKTF